MFRLPLALLVCSACVGASFANAEEAVIRVQADRPGPTVSPHMTGVCIEDVNHEMYGGIYSQMLFGESFQEPAKTVIDGFTAFGGEWIVKNGELFASGGDGPKLIWDGAKLAQGKVAVQIRFDDTTAGLAGLIVKVDEPAVGADRFVGYEISLDPGKQILLLGRHRNNWEPIREVPCDVPLGRWIDLSASMTATGLAISVDGKELLRYEDNEHPLSEGRVGLRPWQRLARYRNLSIDSGSQPKSIAFATADPLGVGGVSGMWRPIKSGTARGQFSLDNDRPYHGVQSQRLQFDSGEGAVGIENQGLNRWGLNFVAGKPYEGYLWLRADKPTKVVVAAQSSDGGSLGEAAIEVTSNEWRRYDFALTPKANASKSTFAIQLEAPGSVVVGHAFLQPGPWGRFKDQPVRKDVADALHEAGVTVMRLGGLMANAPEYRWKSMIGPRDRRAPYKGFWYSHSSNGWGIFEFVNFCEAAGILPIVDLNLDETPADLADFLEYANGPADSAWGAKRAADGHPAPYGLKHVQLGNEEAVDEAYWQKFKPLAEAAWAKDANVVLIVGDFEYRQAITNPDDFDGAPKIRSLATHDKILNLAKEHGRSVWFDVHIWNHSPGDAPPRIAALATFDAALAKLCPGADYKICVLEENATNHAIRRAVAHGETVSGLMRVADRVPIVCSANALQPNGQNDNGWDQGFVFLDPAQAWLQPPAYVTQMISRNRQPQIVAADVSGDASGLDVTATRSADARTLVLQVTNASERPRLTLVELSGYKSRAGKLVVEELTGPLEATNTADAPRHVTPRRRELSFPQDGAISHTFPPSSFTILRFE